MSSKERTTHINRTTSSASAFRKPRNSVGRSQSFGGFSLFTPRRRMENSTNAWAHPVLGDLMRSPKLGRRANLALSSSVGSAGGSGVKNLTESFKKAGLKLPKVPRPQRTITIFQCLKRGIKYVYWMLFNGTAYIY